MAAKLEAHRPDGAPAQCLPVDAASTSGQQQPLEVREVPEETDSAKISTLFQCASEYVMSIQQNSKKQIEMMQSGYEHLHEHIAVAEERAQMRVKALQEQRSELAQMQNDCKRLEELLETTMKRIRDRHSGLKCAPLPTQEVPTASSTPLVSAPGPADLMEGDDKDFGLGAGQLHEHHARSRRRPTINRTLTSSTDGLQDGEDEDFGLGAGQLHGHPAPPSICPTLNRELTTSTDGMLDGDDEDFGLGDGQLHEHHARSSTDGLQDREDEDFGLGAGQLHADHAHHQLSGSLDGTKESDDMGFGRATMQLQGHQPRSRRIVSRTFSSNLSGVAEDAEDSGQGSTQRQGHDMPSKSGPLKFSRLLTETDDGIMECDDKHFGIGNIQLKGAHYDHLTSGTKIRSRRF